MATAGTNGVCPYGFRCRIGAISVAEKKPAAGTEAEMLARVRAMTDAIHQLRQEFLATVRNQRPRRDRADASERPKARKKR